MSTRSALARHEVDLLLADPFPIILLIAMPAVLAAFLAEGLVGGPAAAIPGIAALFGFFGTNVIGIAFFRDHGWRTWNRLRASAARPADVVLAKIAPLAALFFAQQVVLLAVGWLVFGMPFRGSLLAGLATVLAITFAEVALGLLAVACCKDIQQLNAIANLGGLVLAGLGGALAPVASLPDWAQAIARISPVYWALKALRGVVAEGYGLPDVILPVVILTAVGVIATAIALVRYDHDEPKSFFA